LSIWASGIGDPLSLDALRGTARELPANIWTFVDVMIAAAGPAVFDRWRNVGSFPIAAKDEHLAVQSRKDFPFRARRWRRRNRWS
jgi:hypothetical protein